ncbi:ATP-binding protein [Falsigemmobacter intermedius]|uniref:ATP-binding protein n=1 Tax=Falsigemmobacter intermedius TaxID=1553448 RepID=UPI003F1291DF
MAGDPVQEFQGLRRVIAADPFEVRRTLQELPGAIAGVALQEDLRVALEIVLAEVLNNIVEHGYEGQGGDIELSVLPLDRGVMCLVTDKGRPLPDGRLPEGRLPDLPAQPAGLDGLPEGGFGWHMIRALASDIRFDRVRGANQLRFCLRPEAAA